MAYNETPMKGFTMTQSNTSVAPKLETVNEDDTQKISRIAKLKTIATNPMILTAAAGITFSVVAAVIASRKNNAEETDQPMEIAE